MKHLGKFVILGALIAASASFASATPIQLGSYATGTSISGDDNSAMKLVGVDPTSGYPNSLDFKLSSLHSPGTGPGSSNTYTLNPNGVWADAFANSTWVGLKNAGPGGTNPPYGYYEFQTTFDATAGTYDGILNVLADDTVEVLLNGSVILSFGTLGSDTTCSNGATGCLTSTETNQQLTDISLDAKNTLDFIVEQAGQEGAQGTDPSGIDFNATLTQTDPDLTPTPEPSSLLLLGTGLLGAAEIARRKFAAKLAS